MNISVITVVLNNQEFIENCINSVMKQTHADKEHVIIDGGSRDGTMNIINKYRNAALFTSEPDKGIYDAMNKGIAMATGDVIGFLNADDVYYDSSVLANIANVMKELNVDACYSDLVYVDPDDLSRVRRHWKSCEYRDGLLKSGWIPAHPTFYVKKSVFEKYGVFNTDYKLAADYELMARLLGRHKIKSAYIPEVLVKMRVGGITNNSLVNLVKQNMEILRACKNNDIDVSPLSFMVRKLASRIYQYKNREYAL